MAVARIPSKDDCIAVELHNHLRNNYEAVISRIFRWPDPIGYGVDRDRQAMALIEFPQGHAVVWLERRVYAEASESEREEAAAKVLREWARL